MAKMFPFETTKYTNALINTLESATSIDFSLEYPSKDIKKMNFPMSVFEVVCTPSGYAFNAQVFAITAVVTITTYNKKIAATQDSVDIVDAAMNMCGFEQESRTPVDRNGDNLYFVTTRYSKILNNKEAI